MYAIVALAGKQTVLKLGALIDTDLVDANAGDELAIDQVLCFHDGEVAQFGKPHLDKFVVRAKVIEHAKADKIRVVHFKRRQHHLKWQGSRAQYTKLQVVGITGPGVNEKYVEPKAESVDKKPAKVVAKKTSAAPETTPSEKQKESPKKTTKTASTKKAAAGSTKSSKE